MSKHILVIDDDEAIRKSFTLALKDTGYQVDTVESGEKGVAAEKAIKSDLIFLDLKMPGMTGVETLREIRKINPQGRVYIVTAFHKEFFGELKVAAADGINFELLKKPVDSDTIVLVTKSVLEGPTSFE